MAKKITNKPGRPKRTEREALLAAIAIEERNRNVSIYRHMVQQAYRDDKVLVALINKLVPSIKTLDITADINIDAIVASRLSHMPEEQLNKGVAKFRRITG